MNPPDRFTSARKGFIISAVSGAAGLIVLHFQPVASTFHRLAFLTCLALLWFGLLALCRKKPIVSFTLVAIPVLIAGLFALPAKPIQHAELRNDYLRRMENLAGTPYVWGGESSLGIDCSSLPRKALRDALLAYSLRHGDGGTLRALAKHWWFDASAKALSEGYRDYTQPLTGGGTIKEMPYDHLEPGDLVVTENRLHILAYLGGDHWIQADPGLREVAILNGRSDENVWFKVPVSVHRWSVLEAR